MARRHYALIVLLALLARNAPAQAPLAPQAGVVVLRNGQIIEGDVLRAGDYFVVTKGKGSEVWLKTDDVECCCASVLEAYEFKAAHVSGLGTKPHLDLARWCLRQNLYEKCEQQLATAKAADPTNPQIKELETLLALAREAPPPPSAAAPPTGMVSADELEKRLRALPKGSVEKFGAIVQPILLNRCGANRCHGPNAESAFRLLRPPPGQIASRRFTQRNLYETLKHVDSSAPDSSPLVSMPQRRHGNALTAVFDKHSEQQLAELIAWVRLTAANPPAASVSPTRISTTSAALSQPAAAPPPANAPAERTASPQPGIRVMRPPLDQPTGHSAASTRESPLRDPYDPEIFNRRYHGK